MSAKPGQLGDVRAHLGGAERAVDADDQRLGVLDRAPERLDGLPGQRAAGQVDDRHRDPQRQVRGDLAGGGDRGLRVQRVEDRLDQQQVDAALGQRRDLLGVARAWTSSKRHRAVGRVLDPRRQRERDVERADRAGDEPAACLVGGLPGQLRAAQVHLPHQRPAGRSRPGRCCVAVNVFVVVMSAPAARYCRCTSRTTSGRVRLSRSGSPVTSCGWSANRVAAVVGRGQAWRPAASCPRRRRARRSAGPAAARSSLGATVGHLRTPPPVTGGALAVDRPGRAWRTRVRCSASRPVPDSLQRARNTPLSC